MEATVISRDSAEHDGQQEGTVNVSVLQVEDLRKRYSADTQLVCDGLNFMVNEGEFVAIIGPSGCGKSTLLRMLSGILPPTSGQVLLYGDVVRKPPPEMALVFQDYARSLYPWLTVEKNVRFPLARRRDIAKAERDARVDAAILSVGLDGFEDYYPGQLSGGMQQRVAIARALAFQPRILLLDEPFASVDALTKEGLEDTLLRVRDWLGSENNTMLMVTHDIDEAIYLADRIVILSKPPCVVTEELVVNLQRPRNQLATRSDPEFLRIRAFIHDVMGLTDQRNGA
jgi:NitT/TauT family transport system ATP-binding protein